MKKYLSFLVNGTIVDQVAVPPEMTDEQAIALDTMLRERGVITENQEVALTESM